MDIVARHARTQPEAVALVCDEQSLTWAQWDRIKNKFANALTATGVGVGERVVTYLHNGLERFVVTAACDALGLTHVPLNWHLAAPEVAHILHDCDARVVVFDSEFDAVVAAVTPETAAVSSWIRVASERWGSDDFADCYAGADDKAPERLGPGSGTIIYTSGTTGMPKGAFREPQRRAGDEMKTLLAAVIAEMDMRFDDAHLVAGPLYHSAPGFWASLGVGMGRKLVIQRRYDPAEALRLIEEHAVGDTFMAPLLVKRLVELPDDIWAEADTSSLHSLVMAGAPCPFAVKERVRERLGNVLYEFYGATELSVATLLKPEEQLVKPGSCGRAFPGVELAVFDDEGFKVRAGETGTLHVRRNVLTIDGYYGRPGAFEETATGDWLTVGDVAYLDDDGYVFICDRKVDMIISGGVNIYPAEIESALHGHAAVADVCVFGIPDDDWGESVHAVVELREGAELDADEMVAWCDGRLARYKVPRSVEFVTHLPRDAAGKLAKRTLRDPHWAAAERVI